MGLVDSGFAAATAAKDRAARETERMGDMMVVRNKASSSGVALLITGHCLVVFGRGPYQYDCAPVLSLDPYWQQRSRHWIFRALPRTTHDLPAAQTEVPGLLVRVHLLSLPNETCTTRMKPPPLDQTDTFWGPVMVGEGSLRALRIQFQGRAKKPSQRRTAQHDPSERRH